MNGEDERALDTFEGEGNHPRPPATKSPVPNGADDTAEARARMAAESGRDNEPA